MRLALVSPFGFTPKATLSHRILPIAKALRKKGHETVIFIPPYTNPEASGRVEDRSGVKLVNIILPDAAPKAWCGVHSLRIGFRLASEVKRFNPDKIYIFKPKGYSALAGMMLWFRGGKYPIYLDIDDLESDRGMEKRMGYGWGERFFFRYQERWLLKRAEKVTTASRFLTQLYGKKTGGEKVHYLPNGPAEAGGIEDNAVVYGMEFQKEIPTTETSHGRVLSSPISLADEVSCQEGEGREKKESLKEKTGVQGKKIVLLYTRFTECLVKDIIDFVRLFSKKYSRGILLIAGEGYGREREGLAAEIEKAGLSGSVRFTGWIEREELKDYLSLGDAAIYPLSDTAFNRAKCSAKLIELLSMEKPVVASPVGEALTYIRDGESGLLAKDIEEMAEKVIGLLEDEVKAKKIGEGARHFLSDNFSWDKLVNALDEKK